MHPYRDAQSCERSLPPPPRACCSACRSRPVPLRRPRRRRTRSPPPRRSSTRFSHSWTTSPTSTPVSPRSRTRRSARSRTSRPRSTRLRSRSMPSRLSWSRSRSSSPRAFPTPTRAARETALPWCSPQRRLRSSSTTSTTPIRSTHVIGRPFRKFARFRTS